MLRERTISIDLNEGNYRILRYKQYDDNNILKVIIQENKEEVDLSMYTARFFFKLPSESILQKDTVIEDNKIVVVIDSGILSESGRIIVDLTLSSVDQLVTAFTMYIDVEETIDRNEAVQSKPEWDLITNTLNNLDTKVDKVDGKSLISNTEIERLANVDNYDDTELRNLIDTKSDVNHNHDTQYASKSTEHIHDNKSILDGITDGKINEWDNKSEFSGSYNDLTDKPIIPTVDVNKTYVDEQLANKSDVDHTHTELHTHSNKNILDIITQEKINEWSNHFSGDYNDLTNKPTIPSLDGYATENYVKNAIVDAQLGGGSSGGDIDLSGYATKDELNAKADVSDIPTKVSELDNDSNFISSIPSEYVTETELNAKGYLTEHQDISGKVDKVSGKSLIADTEIARLSNMEDNANNYIHPSTHNASMIVEDNTHRFITDLERVNWNNKVDTNQLHEHSNKDILDTITSDKITNWNNAEENIQSDWNETDDTLDSYIKNKPSIPTKVSELTNDGVYATETYVQNKIAEAQVGGSVDLSSYALKVDLDEKVDKVSGKGLSTNDYTTEEKEKLAGLSTVATSGSYNDLTDKPTIPTKTSELTNDSSFASESYVTNAINNAQLGGSGTSVDLSIYQTKSDSTLTTDAKTVVGAINELDVQCIKAVNYSTVDTTIGNDVSNRLTELETNKADKTYVDEQVANVSVDLSDYQTKSDTTLETTDKTVVGAINELETTKIEAKDYDSGVDYTVEGTTVDLSDYALKIDIPIKISELENDSGYLTEHQDLSTYQTKTDETLTTTDKTIVGAINELFQYGNDVKQKLVDALVAKGIICSTDDSFDTLIGYISTLGAEEIGDIWKSMTNMTSSTYNLAGAESINDKIYCVGNSLNYCYTPSTDTWETKTQSLTTRLGSSTSVANQKIYCLGGLNASNGDYLNTNEYYDPSTDTWTTKTNMPYQMANFSSSSVDNLIYATGGYKYGQVENNNTNFCYSPSTDTWTTKCNMNYQRLYHTSSVSNDMMYVFGGETSSVVSDTCECYDISTNTWTTKAIMPIARQYLTSSTVNNEIYVIGGYNSDGATSLNYCYDPSTDTWTKKESMLSSKYSCHSAVIDNKIYVIGGYDVNNNKLITNECYTPKWDN